MLYDLLTDPAEQFDIAARHPEIVAALQKEVAQHVAGLEEKHRYLINGCSSGYSSRLVEFVYPTYVIPKYFGTRFVR